MTFVDLMFVHWNSLLLPFMTPAGFEDECGEDRECDDFFVQRSSRDGKARGRRAVQYRDVMGAFSDDEDDY